MVCWESGQKSQAARDLQVLFFIETSKECYQYRKSVWAVRVSFSYTDVAI